MAERDGISHRCVMPPTWPNRLLLVLLPSTVVLLFFHSLRTTNVRPAIVAPLDTFPSAEPEPEPRILLVSGFFPLSKSKHPMSDYQYWLERFLRPITTDIYFYAPPEMEELVRRCRGSDLPITVDTSYASPFDIPPLKGLREPYEAMHAQDRESFRHSAELYAVWNAKPFFLDNAVQMLNASTYDYAFWNDAGSFRSDHRYTRWPHPARIRQLWREASALTGERTEDLLFWPLTGLPHASMRNWKEEDGPVDNEVSEGSFFGGSPSMVAWWRRVFYAYHDHYLRRGLFVGKDQTLINAILLLFPSRIISVWLGDPDAPAHVGLLPVVDQGALGNCGAEWFYYQFWLASEEEQDAMRELWEANARWSWTWWKERQKCRVTRVSALTDLLRHRFGPDWRPPLHTIEP
ncbi:hypothetical protein MKEN_01408300 [Mycena kentingensis (nom. inval.)]|nr:hypothetical protein MKEN_01408300 [Mycena kentingensis (nom. inval.)]